MSPCQVRVLPPAHLIHRTTELTALELQQVKMRINARTKTERPSQEILLGLCSALCNTLLAMALVLSGCARKADYASAPVSGFSVTSPDLSPAKPIGDYYVSISGSDIDGNGSYKRPWRSIDKAASIALPGFTVHVLPGTYVF